MCVNSSVDSDIVHFRVFDAGPICAYSFMDSGIPHLGVFISAAICVNSSMDSDIMFFNYTSAVDVNQQFYRF